jgi:hypothetical protein
VLLALAERLNSAAWTDADQITTGLQQAAEALERLSHVFAKRRRRSKKRGGSAAERMAPAAPRTEPDAEASPEPAVDEQTASSDDPSDDSPEDSPDV